MDKVLEKKEVSLYKREQKYFVNQNTVKSGYPPFQKPFYISELIFLTFQMHTSLWGLLATV